MSRKGLFAFFVLVFLVVTPVFVSGQEVEVAVAGSPAPTIERPPVLAGELGQETEVCFTATGVPMALPSPSSTEDLVSSPLQASFCMCDHCICGACDCAGGVVTVRCCAMALGSICLAISSCDCLLCAQ